MVGRDLQPVVAPRSHAQKAKFCTSNGAIFPSGAAAGPQKIWAKVESTVASFAGEMGKDSGRRMDANRRKRRGPKALVAKHQLYYFPLRQLHFGNFVNMS